MFWLLSQTLSHPVIINTNRNYDYDRLATGRWFSPDPLVSSTNKTDHHNINEILLKVALKHHQTNYFSLYSLTFTADMSISNQTFLIKKLP
jgi:hypothetical protein